MLTGEQEANVHRAIRRTVTRAATRWTALAREQAPAEFVTSGFTNRKGNLVAAARTPGLAAAG